MTPITKNITVVDENGNILDSTYPKRAKGLVKKGRAQWVNNTVICLCAYRKKEENQMANNIYEILDNQITKMQEQLNDTDDESAAQVRIQILKTLEVFRVQEQNAKLISVTETQLNMLQESLKTYDTFTPENVLARENTNQKIIELLEKLVNINQNSNTI